MILKCFFSSPEGDLPVQAQQLAGLFLLSDTGVHETITLGLYFDAIKNIILQNKAQLRQIINLHPDPDHLAKGDSIKELIIRSEKHGLFYHIASAEVFFNDTFSAKFAVSTALSEDGLNCLRRDYLYTKKLSALPGCSSYLPNLYLLEESPFPLPDHNGQGLMVVGEWLEDFHEWHQSFNKEKKEYQLILWDYPRGNRFLAPKQGDKVFQQIAKILTSMYNLDSHEQIYPWHHAAGDFIVKCRKDTIEVRLISVRDYRPILAVPTGKPASQLTGLIVFFLHLSIRMRLDKLDGVGDTIWLNDYVVPALTQGFFSALEEKNSLTEMPFSPVQLLEILRSFSEEDFFSMCQPLLGIYRHEADDDFQVIQNNIKPHLAQVCEALRSIRNIPRGLASKIISKAPTNKNKM